MLIWYEWTWFFLQNGEVYGLSGQFLGITGMTELVRPYSSTDQIKKISNLVYVKNYVLYIDTRFS